MKKLILVLAIALIAFTSCDKESMDNPSPYTANSLVSSASEDPKPEEYTVNNCGNVVSVSLSPNYEPHVVGFPALIGGPIPPGGSNSSICWASNLPPVNVAIVNFSISLPDLNLEGDKVQIPCIQDAQAFLEIKNLKGTPQYVEGYGLIDKRYPITQSGISQMKFNINAFLRCDPGSPEFDNDPTGPNGPYWDYNPHNPPLGYLIVGDKFFAYRVVVYYYNKCQDLYCTTETPWTFFEWIW